MKITPISKFLLLVLNLFFVYQASADETTAMLCLKIGDQKIEQGECLTNDFDFNQVKFSIIDEDGIKLEKYKIVDGMVMAEQVSAENANPGTILPTGRLDQKAIKLISTAKGSKINISVRTYYGSNLLERTWKFHFYIEVEPTLVFGTIHDGDEGVELGYLKELRAVQVAYLENPQLVKYKIVKGMVTVNGLANTGAILQSGQLHIDAIQLLQNAKGKEVKITVLYKEPNGKEHKKSLTFTVGK